MIDRRYPLVDWANPESTGDANLRSVMGLIGATSLKELRSSRVKRALAVQFPTVISAFPWAEEQMRR